MSELKAQFDEKGFIVIDNFVTPEYAAQLKQEISKLSDEAMNTDGSIRVHRLLRSPEIANFIVDRKIKNLAITLMGANPVLGALGSNTVMPNAPGMGQHRDYPYFSMHTGIIPSAMPILALQYILLLDDLSCDNAPTLIMPESHKLRGWILNKEYFEKNAMSLVAQAGSLVAMHGGVFHGVAMNKSSKSRTTLLATFYPHWVRPFSSYLGLDPENASDELKSLLGADFKQRIRSDMEIIGYGMAKKEK